MGAVDATKEKMKEIFILMEVHLKNNNGVQSIRQIHVSQLNLADPRHTSHMAEGQHSEAGVTLKASPGLAPREC